jgi:hypothetical protein
VEEQKAKFMIEIRSVVVLSNVCGVLGGELENVEITTYTYMSRLRRDSVAFF